MNFQIILYFDNTGREWGCQFTSPTMCFEDENMSHYSALEFSRMLFEAGACKMSVIKKHLKHSKP